jgi:predicted nucleic acid-binding protein
VLYLDSSALVKRYQAEQGTTALNARLEEEARNSRLVFTSVLAYAEVHSAVSRLTREKQWSKGEARKIRNTFDADWLQSFSPVELSVGVLSFVRSIAARFVLRGADIVHLASALWLRDMGRLGVKPDQYPGSLVFASSDVQLLKAAVKCQVQVFNPQTI